LSITLASLVARLTVDVLAQSGVPTAAQYAQAVKDAVADLSRRASVARVASLAIVAGTAAYALPSDFQALIRLAAIGVAYPRSSSIDYGDYQGGTLITPAGLVPFSGSYREQITISGGALLIYPTPTVSAERQLVYAAGDAILDDSYPTLTEDRAAIALLLAKAACLDRIATSPSGQAVKITAGGDSVDFSTAAAGLRGQAAGLRVEYLAAIASLNAGSGGLG
jgi:hypothetical protein